MNELEKARQRISEIDGEMAKLFIKRMCISSEISKYKAEHNLPVLDIEREKALIEKNKGFIEDEELLPFYYEFLKSTMDISKEYQKALTEKMLNHDFEKLSLKLGHGECDIVIGRGLLCRAFEFFNLDRKVLIVTDSGVPKEYSEVIAKQCKFSVIKTVPAGEKSKNLAFFEELCCELLINGFTRSDCVVAVGGGVVGDLAGFVASSFMRGIDFYNVPTTVLSQVDSSVGGKTAVNFKGIKNIIGTFYQPNAIIIDPNTLSTLSPRHFSNGLAESVKMAACFDEKLFELFENRNARECIDEIISASVKIKAKVIEKDETEKGIRRVLNFGHTFGHAIESAKGLEELYHGECIGIGMLPMCSDDIRERLISIFKKLDLPYEYSGNFDELIFAVTHDKKFFGENIEVITLSKIGKFQTEVWSREKLLDRMEAFFA